MRLFASVDEKTLLAFVCLSLRYSAAVAVRCHAHFIPVDLHHFVASTPGNDIAAGNAFRLRQEGVKLGQLIRVGERGQTGVRDFSHQLFQLALAEKEERILSLDLPPRTPVGIGCWPGSVLTADAHGNE